MNKPTLALCFSDSVPQSWVDACALSPDIEVVWCSAGDLRDSTVMVDGQRQQVSALESARAHVALALDAQTLGLFSSRTSLDQARLIDVARRDEASAGVDNLTHTPNWLDHSNTLKVLLAQLSELECVQSLTDLFIHIGLPHAVDGEEGVAELARETVHLLNGRARDAGDNGLVRAFHAYSSTDFEARHRRLALDYHEADAAFVQHSRASWQWQVGLLPLFRAASVQLSTRQSSGLDPAQIQALFGPGQVGTQSSPSGLKVSWQGDWTVLQLQLAWRAAQKLYS